MERDPRAMAAPTDPRGEQAETLDDGGATRTGDLLERMRAGDRLAAAAFMTENRDLIRRRFRSRISGSMRRLFDSHDLVATMARRLDQIVEHRDLGAASAGELWSLLASIAAYSLSEHRKRSLTHREFVDAHQLAEATPVEDAPPERLDGAALLGHCLDRLEDPLDGTLLLLRLGGLSHAQIAACVGMSSESVRKRWQRVRVLLHGLGGLQ